VVNPIGYNTVLYTPAPQLQRGNELAAPGSVNQRVANSSDETSVSKNSLNERALERMGIKECETCKHRRYQDVSSDPSVSFQSPTHVSPDMAALAVSSHEQEHVSHEQTRAMREDRRVVFQSVQIFTSVCPECGRVYVSGGKTKTVTAPVNPAPMPEQLESGLILDKYG